MQEQREDELQIEPIGRDDKSKKLKGAALIAGFVGIGALLLVAKLNETKGNADAVAQEAADYQVRKVEAPEPPPRTATTQDPRFEAPVEEEPASNELPPEIQAQLAQMAAQQHAMQQDQLREQDEAIAAERKRKVEEAAAAKRAREKASIMAFASQSTQSGAHAQGEDAANTTDTLDPFAPRVGRQGQQGQGQQNTRAFAFAPESGATGIDTVQAAYLGQMGTRVNAGRIVTGVLETPINSDLPGVVRAVVSDDVYAQDGTQVLIPKGSQLLGEYQSGLQQGQSRVFVLWTRLMRPDGVAVQLASAGADGEGVAGMTGRVNRHFFQRFGAAFLLSFIDVYREENRDSTQIVVGTDATNQAVGQLLQSASNIPPTVHVKKGSRVTILVQKDLDFSRIAEAGFIVQ